MGQGSGLTLDAPFSSSREVNLSVPPRLFQAPDLGKLIQCPQYYELAPIGSFSTAMKKASRRTFIFNGTACWRSSG